MRTRFAFPRRSPVPSLAITVIVLVILSMVQTTAPAAIYKWVDEKGRVHFSQSLPPDSGKNATRIQLEGESDQDFDPSADVRAAYCNAIEEIGLKIARKMSQGASAERAFLMVPDNESEVLAKQIIGYVYHLKGHASTRKIAGLVRFQCMHGSYDAHMQSFLKSKYPGGLPERVSGSKTKTGTGQKSGTAWPVSRGFVITNNHVVSGRSKLTLIRVDGFQITARVVDRDEENDLALLTVDDPELLPRPLPLRTVPASLGAEVFTIGFPHLDLMGRAPKVTEGIVSSQTGLRDDDRYYQISVPVQAGNSGGPLIDMDGRVIGVVTAKLDALAVFQRSGSLPENVNYAIKSSLIAALLRNTTGSASPEGAISPTGRTLAALISEIKPSVLILLAQ